MNISVNFSKPHPWKKSLKIVGAQEIQKDSSVDQSACCQAQWPELNSQELHDGGRTDSTHCPDSAYTHIHSHTEKCNFFKRTTTGHSYTSFAQSQHTTETRVHPCTLQHYSQPPGRPATDWVDKSTQHIYTTELCLAMKMSCYRNWKNAPFLWWRCFYLSFHNTWNTSCVHT